MLVLSRKRGEQIVLPDCDVSITVLRIHGNRVQLGITAPSSMSVRRAEIAAKPQGPRSAVSGDQRPATRFKRRTANTKHDSADVELTGESTLHGVESVLIPAQ